MICPSGPATGRSWRPFGLLAIGGLPEQVDRALSDIQRVPQVVADDAGELLESVVLALQFALTLDTFSDIA